MKVAAATTLMAFFLLSGAQAGCICSTCFSGEEEAKRTSIAAPTTRHGPINVELRKQGVLDKDYDIINLDTGEPWMLIDTVGGIFSKEMKYHMKHRYHDQKESTNLGTGTIRNSDTEFEHSVTESKTKVDWDSDADIFSIDSAGDLAFDFEPDLELVRKLSATWKLSKEIHLFADKEMEQHIGYCSVKCKGKYKRKTKKIIDFHMVNDRDQDGKVIGQHREQQIRYDVKHKTKPKQFNYKCTLFGEDYDIGVQSLGKSFHHGPFIWNGTNSEQKLMFEIHGDGKNAQVKTFETQNVVVTLLLSFAIGCQFDPQDMKKLAFQKCRGIRDTKGFIDVY